MKPLEIRIVRSEKRKKTLQARKKEGVLEILAPAHLTDVELAPHIESLLKRLENRERGKSLDDEALHKRALELNSLYFHGDLSWESIFWVTNQEKRHGSCHPRRKSIRISHRIASMPKFVQDYVLVHELAHLIEPNHSKNFWRLVNNYPRTERARGYLMAIGLEEAED